ncbi:MAG: peptidyl-prolyl cis-trans isomerase [Muribaculaceae bacterium]|nr:peptidyl-prolyl cis-trans isomerase [Muribaculaceae bacterium]
MKKRFALCRGLFPFGLVSALLPAFLLSGCRGGERTRNIADDVVLVSAGDTSLTLRDAELYIPSGLSEEDSIAMLRQIADRWVRNILLIDLAEKSIPDMEEIDRMVEDYRRDLIVNRYLSSVGETASEASEAQLRQYYNKHREELLLEVPVIKGVFLKVAADNSNLHNIRRWMASGSEASIDRIEKMGLRNAIKYEYFPDRWIDWNIVADQIPYRFYDADAFVEGTRDFETSYDGSVYFLHISEYLPSGTPMPYDYARNRIAGIIGRKSSAAKSEDLFRRLCRERLGDGFLTKGLYDPVTGKLSPRNESNAAGREVSNINKLKNEKK